MAAMHGMDRQVRCASALVLTLQDGDWWITVPGAFPACVRLPELMLLEALAWDRPVSLDGALAMAAARARIAPGELLPFVERMRGIGYLVERPAARPWRRAIDSRGSNGVRRVAPHDQVVVTPPRSALVRNGGFELWDHGAAVGCRLSAIELHALRALTSPRTVSAAWEVHRESAGRLALDQQAFSELLGWLAAADVASVLPPGQAASRQMFGVEGSVTTSLSEGTRRLYQAIVRQAEARDAAENGRAARTGAPRPAVIPVAFDPCPPLGLGLIMAYARVHEGGVLDDFYDLRSEWVWIEERLAHNTARPAVYLFSNYLWSHADCMRVSEQVKQRNPASITIHGGPDTPKYSQDVEDYFRAHPSVDVTVRGEGEFTTAEVLAALRPVVGHPRPDLTVLANVRGISFRLGDRVVTTPDRERIADLDMIPSPFLTGLFDAYGEAPGTVSVVTETNRGCPYGCTFCDWGSATLSRIRKFSLERVFAEIEWCAAHGMLCIGPADANFGIFDRDVEIAERIADARRRYGFPKAFGVSYAKNSVKHLQHVIEIMAKAGIVTHGILSLQTMDPDTLDVVRRSNIKTAKYDELASEFRRARLPLFVDLMMGLPGATTTSFRNDLQQCVNREVQVRIAQTTLLINSPMNEPSYREQHVIETAEPFRPGVPRFIVATKTYTRDQYDEMVRLRRLFLVVENFGVLRHVARFVRQEAGLPEVDFYERLRTDTERDPEAWPMLRLLAATVPFTMCAPGSWRLLMDEVGDYVTEVVGLVRDDALETVLAVQAALLPAHGRSLPETLTLPHDYASWYAAMLQAKESSHRDEWISVVPRLRDHPPGRLTIDDPGDAVRRAIGMNLELYGFGANWEFQSSVRRAFSPVVEPDAPLAASEAVDVAGRERQDRSVVSA